ncbi:MAG: hypothetical protein KA734_11415 [Fluviicola sp.]|nr:hypothetical protein [Fluviicola sp.]
MLQRDQLKIEKLARENPNQLAFLTANVRDFYVQEIVSWQYENKAYATGLFFVKENDQYIATQGMIPIFLKAHGKQVLTAKSESSFLLPAFRGKGIFETLYLQTIETSEQDGVELVWGFTELSKVWREKLAFDVVDGLIHESELQIRFLKSFISSWSSKQSLTNKLKSSLKAVVSLLKSKQLPKPNKEYSAAFIALEEADNLQAIIELSATWEKNHPTFTTLLLDEAYINWRITNNPVARYQIIGIYSNRQLVGYGVVNNTSKKAYLLDFIVPEQVHFTESFMALLRILKGKGSVSHLIYWASHKNDYASSIHDLFQSRGAFRHVNNSMNFVYKKTKKSTMDNIEISDLYINGLWTEGFSI